MQSGYERTFHVGLPPKHRREPARLVSGECQEMRKFVNRPRSDFAKRRNSCAGYVPLTCDVEGSKRSRGVEQLDSAEGKLAAILGLEVGAGLVALRVVRPTEFTVHDVRRGKAGGATASTSR